MSTKRTQYNLEERLIDFAVMINGLTKWLLSSHIGRHLAGN
jgi:hypothetical protein